MKTVVYWGNGGRFSVRQLRAALLASTVLTACGSLSAFAQNAPVVQTATRPVSVPAGPLTAALNRLSAQTGLQLLFDAQLANGKTTRGVQGNFTARQALTEVLAGTGLNARFTGANSATIAGPANIDAGAAPAGSIMLDTIDVAGGRGGNGAAADLPYRTPGSSTYVTAEQIMRVPPSAAGEIFRTVPGVTSGQSRNGAALNVNIRGLQGMNRVKTTIDGAEQSTSTYRGYFGVDNRTFVDPELIGGMLVEKGPTSGANGAGAIGGVVSIQTLGVDDILKPGESHAVRIRAGTASNMVSPPPVGTLVPTTGDRDLFGSSAFVGSVATAIRKDDFDLVAAFSRRKAGNYFAGKHGPTEYINEQKLRMDYTPVKPGQEVFNTSQDVTSGLLKGTARWDGGHSLQLGYIYYGNQYGEVTPLMVQPTIFRQFDLTHTTVNNLSAKYRFNPEGNQLVDFRLNAWMTHTNEHTNYMNQRFTDPWYTTTRMPTVSRMYGVDASNTSKFETAFGSFDFNYGASMSIERAKPQDETPGVGLVTLNGEREIGSLFLKTEWRPIEWLKLGGGLRYDTYNVQDKYTREQLLPLIPSGVRNFPAYEGGKLNPSASVTIIPWEGIQFFGLFAQGIRPPSLRESGNSSSGLYPNPYLLPETSKNYEAGMNVDRDGVFIAGDKTRLKVSYFNNTVDNYIFREGFPINPFLSGLMPANLDKAKFSGFETQLSYDAKSFFVELGTNYYDSIEFCRVGQPCIAKSPRTQEGNISDYTANHIPPKFMMSGTFGVRVLDERLTLGTRVTHATERAIPSEHGNTGDISVVWAPFTTVDVFANYKLTEDISLQVSGENLGDRFYVDPLGGTRLPAPGRTIRASVTGRFGDSKPLPNLHFGRMPVAEPGSSWTGLYAGGHASYGFGRTNGITRNGKGIPGGIPATESVNLELHDLAGGGQVGFSYQFSNRMVLGFEVDYAKTRLTDYQDAIATENPFFPRLREVQAKTEYSLDWMATIRGRAGYALDRTLIYATGGVAFLKERQERTQYGPPAFGTWTYPVFKESAEITRTGWTLGGGAEYAIDGHWSMKAEYLYSHFGSEDFLFPKARAGVLPATSTIVDGRVASNELDLHLLKLGLNYRF